MSKTYPVSVFWSEEDGGFIALAPDLPGCSAFGDTQQEALNELQAAVTAWIDAAQKAGNAVPRPSNPSAELEVSGKYPLRMPKSLHWSLIQGAKREGVSLNQHLVFLLTRATASAESSIAASSMPNSNNTSAGTIRFDTNTLGADDVFVGTAASPVYPTQVAAVKAARTVVIKRWQMATPVQVVGTTVDKPTKGAVH